MYPSSIKGWDVQDRPREKLQAAGRSALSDSELLAILIGSGTQGCNAIDLSRKILQSVNYNLNELAQLTIKDLMKFPGIGEAKAINIVSALELGRRRKEAAPDKKDKVTSSSDAYEVLSPLLLDHKHEEFWLLLLSRSNEVMKKIRVSSGGVSGTVADPKIIYKHALDHLASAIIIAHNHPSGNLNPSREDKLLTEKIKKAGEFLDVRLLDHIIVTNHSYYSFADEDNL